VVSFTDAVVIVTGGSRGPGRELACALAGRGYSVVVVYLDDQNEAEAAVDEIVRADGTALAVRADVTDELDVERLFTETIAAFGGADVIVHSDPRGSRLVDQQAARSLRHGGAILYVICADAMTADLADQLRARGITVTQLTPRLERSGAHPGITPYVAILDQWQRTQVAGPGD
jgi:3-oxoacyl-[acyl-carrier protein] reductase